MTPILFSLYIYSLFPLPYIYIFFLNKEYICYLLREHSKSIVSRESGITRKNSITRIRVKNSKKWHFSKNLGLLGKKVFRYFSSKILPIVDICPLEKDTAQTLNDALFALGEQ